MLMSKNINELVMNLHMMYGKYEETDTQDTISVVKRHLGSSLGTPGMERRGPSTFISLKHWISMKPHLGECHVSGCKAC